MSVANNVSGFFDVAENQDYTAEQLGAGIVRYCENTGKSFIVLESAWWGNEKFGTWEQYFVVDVERTTEKAMQLVNVETLDSVKRAVAQKERAVETIMEEEVWQYGENYLTETLQESEMLLTGQTPARTLRVDRGWVPSSKVAFRADFEGPANFVSVDETGEWDRLRRDEPEILIEDTIVTEYGAKLAVNIRPYMEDKANDLLDAHMDGNQWATYHFTGGSLSNGDFTWVADASDPEGFAKDLAAATEMIVGVHERFWGDDVTPA